MASEQTGLKRDLGLFSAMMIVAGSMIGSGIFIVSADVARQVQSPGGLLLVWLLAAVITFCGAFSYSKLAKAFPEAGGQYVFLRKAWGDLPAFVYGLALFGVIQSGTLAAVAVAFAKFSGVFLPQVSAENALLTLGTFSISSQQALAIGVLLLLTAFNITGVKQGAMLQNVFTVLKVLAVLALAAIGFLAIPGSFPTPSQWQFHTSLSASSETPIWIAIALASVGPLFASDAWNNVTFIASEVKAPETNLPKAMVGGVLLVLVLYLVVNIGYLNALPFDLIQHAPEDRVATAVLNHLFGSVGAWLMAGVILVSTFGCLNGMILAGARVYYAMAQDGLFLKGFERLHGQFKTPVISLLGQCLVAIALTLSGSYGQLLDYIIFTTLLFYGLTVLGLFRLNHQDPKRIPLKSVWDWGIPIIYLIFISYIGIFLGIFKSDFSLRGLVIVGIAACIYVVSQWLKSHKAFREP